MIIASCELSARQGQKSLCKVQKFKRNTQRLGKHVSSLSANIANVKLALSFLKKLEELRDLSLAEWNYKKILRASLAWLRRKQLQLRAIVNYTVATLFSL